MKSFCLRCEMRMRFSLLSNVASPGRTAGQKRPTGLLVTDRAFPGLPEAPGSSLCCIVAPPWTREPTRRACAAPISSAATASCTCITRFLPVAGLMSRPRSSACTPAAAPAGPFWNCRESWGAAAPAYRIGPTRAGYGHVGVMTEAPLVQVSGLKRVPSGSRPYAGHSAMGRVAGVWAARLVASRDERRHRVLRITRSPADVEFA